MLFEHHGLLFFVFLCLPPLMMPFAPTICFSLDVDAIQPTVFMYSSAIWTAERSDSYQEALEFFNEMKSLECTPNSVSYDGVISVLSRTLDVKRTLETFEEMKRNFCSPTSVTFQVS
jgi:pentatricopeptide repeat protein